MKRFIPGKSIIPVSGQEISDEDVAVLHEVVDSRWYTEHRHCIEFRKNLAQFFGKKHATLTNSGSSASLVAMTTAVSQSNPDKDYVITTALAFPTTIAPIYQNGKIPFYVDVDLETLTPDSDQCFDAKDLWGKDIQGGIFTHILGFPFYEKFQKCLWDWLIADCCDALGAQVYDKSVGTNADLVTCSFFPAHHITAAEGGVVLTNHTDWAAVADSIVNWGRSCYCNPGQSNTCGHRFDWEERGDLPEGWDHKYIFDRLGYNLKMTEFQAALGNSQLSNVALYLTARMENYDYYHFELGKYDKYLMFPKIIEGGYPSPFGFPIYVKENAPFSAEKIIGWLENHKITTRRMFSGNIVRQPGFKNLPYKSFDLTNTDRIAERMFWIGIHPSITRVLVRLDDNG